MSVTVVTERIVTINYKVYCERCAGFPISFTEGPQAHKFRIEHEEWDHESEVTSATGWRSGFFAGWKPKGEKEGI